ncbi:putative deacetylase LmbE-like domain-containing protein [Podospora appendiculata]|uniref:N-acetylglucosaminylphosphatidylinositol deacetylase n=1 Tax=Podospora appendiculata TaxID=314037 RepID=A0AAE0WZH7_9PEZI|nr:putative deacetylase LmbE-like domain-containing protein [Podospora appendiculata]
MTQFLAKPVQYLSSLVNRVPRRVWRWVLRVAVLALLVPPILQWIIAYLVGSDARILPPQLLAAKNLLIVTAHPDDECLFFAPSILGVLDRNKAMTGGLLVMSTGNNYGIGEQRKLELMGSCKALGISDQRCVALDHADLQDNPTVWWDTPLIEGIVDKYVKKWDIDAILTFDEGGVSGHINHRAVSAAVSNYAATNLQAPVTFTLTTASLPRKYTILGDLPLTALPFAWRILEALSFPTSTADVKDGGRALVANTWHRYLMTRDAFSRHPSQYTWDRHLYMIVSRYVWFNDLKRVSRVTAAAAAGGTDPAHSKN